MCEENEMTTREISNYIDRERIRKGMTYRDLAEAQGPGAVKYGTWLNRIRSGAGGCTLESVIKLADALGLELHLRPKGTIDYIESTDHI